MSRNVSSIKILVHDLINLIILLETPKFIGISLSSMKKFYLKSVHHLLSDLLSTESFMLLYKKNIFTNALI